MAMDAGRMRVEAYRDVELLVENGVSENLHIEYKSGKPHKVDKFGDDLAQDVAAFANSDGGFLIVGVDENGTVPVRICGIEESKVTVEWLDSVISSKVNPYIADLKIYQLEKDETRVIVVSVPKSSRAPHQGPKRTYYRRYQYHTEPMEGYEIDDVRRRRLSVDPLVLVSTASRGAILAAIDVSNVGRYPAEEVRFEFSSTAMWPNDTVPIPLRKGITCLHPGQKLRFRAQTFAHMLADEEEPAVYSVNVTYRHPAVDVKLSHAWYLDFESYRESLLVTTDEDQDRNDIKKTTKEIASALKGIDRKLEKMAQLMCGFDGIDLSTRTMRNILKIKHENGLEKIDPVDLSFYDIATILNVDGQIAQRIKKGLDAGIKAEQFIDMPEITREVAERVIQTFHF